MTVKDKILQGRTYLGIELGSTRIKAVLIDDSFSVIASGSKQWENRFENGCWTYSLDDIHGVKLNLMMIVNLQLFYVVILMYLILLLSHR